MKKNTFYGIKLSIYCLFYIMPYLPCELCRQIPWTVKFFTWLYVALDSRFQWESRSSFSFHRHTIFVKFWFILISDWKMSFVCLAFKFWWNSPSAVAKSTSVSYWSKVPWTSCIYWFRYIGQSIRNNSKVNTCYFLSIDFLGFCMFRIIFN